MFPHLPIKTQLKIPFLGNCPAEGTLEKTWSNTYVIKLLIIGKVVMFTLKPKE